MPAALGSGELAAPIYGDITSLLLLSYAHQAAAGDPVPSETPPPPSSGTSHR